MSRVPALAAGRLNDRPRPDLPLLVVGPSLGTSARRLWGRVAFLLRDDLDVIGWDLPGHGASTPAADGFEVADLATAVLAVAERAQADRGDVGAPFCYAGDSVGGAVGLELLLVAPERVAAAVVLCSGAKIGDADGWGERAADARTSGTASMVAASKGRWFAAGFADREPTVVSELLDGLRETDDESYAQVCEALAHFDVRARLADITAPVLAVAGVEDEVAPPDLLRAVADGVANGRLVVLDGTSHLAPAEAPELVAQLIRDHIAAPRTASRGGSRKSAEGSPLDDGMAVRRAVLGDAYVDRATAAATDFSRDFQEFITAYAWGGVWTRPGLSRRTRSMITLTALVAGGHHDELALHVRAARNNGVTADEIKEVLLHAAIYVGVPAANSAFKVAQQVLDELEPLGDPDEQGD